jgi:hypothetical protein
MEDPMLGGHWNVPCLVAIGMFHAWWPLEDPMLGGHWNVPCLVAIGMFHAWWPLECEGKNTLSPLPFSSNNFTYALNFSLDPTVLLYQGPKPSLTPLFPLLRSINYDCASPCNKSFTSSLST